MDAEEPSRSDAPERYGSRFAHLSAGAQEVATIVDSLTKSSRAARFYAPNNRALQAFMQELYGLLDAHFARQTELNLKVRPTTLLWADTDEQVYEDDDRENGIPFRLYRDGIRILTLKRGLSHAEVRQLQEILSMRSFGKLEEEDIATLLWRTRNKHVQFSQVRGFHDAPAEPEVERLPDASFEALSEVPSEAPPTDGHPDEDLLGPLAIAEFGSLERDSEEDDGEAPPSISGRWLDEWRPVRPGADDPAPRYSPVSDGQRQLFRKGYAFDPGAVLTHVIVRCLDAGRSGMASAPLPQELFDLLEDARYAQLVAGELQTYHRVVKVLQEQIHALPPGDPWRDSFVRYLREGGGRSTVRLLLGAVGSRSAEPRHILPLLRAFEQIEDEWLTDALGDAADEEGSARVAELVVELMWPDQERIAKLTEACDPEDLSALVQVLCQREFDEVKALLTALFPMAMPEAQVLIGRIALAHETKEGLARLARQALDSASEPVRALGLQMALRSENPRLVKQIDRMVEPSALMQLTRETAVEALRTWALMPGRSKMEWLIKHARPPRVLVSRKQEELRIRYVLALGAIGTPMAEAVLRKLRGKGSEAFQEAAAQALERAQKERRS